MSLRDDTSPPGRPAPLLVCRGRLPLIVAGGLMLGSFLGTLFAVVALVRLTSEHKLPWLANTALGSVLGEMNPGLAGFLGVVLAVPAAWIVGAFAERRSGTVTLLEGGILWDVRVHEPGEVVPWGRFEGFRDTPHPWVEVLSRKGVARTIPVSSEPERERLLEVLARFVKNLGLPPDERKEPTA